MGIRRHVLISLALLLGTARLAGAGEEEDLQRQIELQRTNATDLERLDETRAAGEEITRLKDWLNQAWTLRSRHEVDEVRPVLDRCAAQAELVRQMIMAARWQTQVKSREAAIERARNKTQQTRSALQKLQAERRELEEKTQ
jgi:cysteinyl-tRNA synthetase